MADAVPRRLFHQARKYLPAFLAAAMIGASAGAATWAFRAVREERAAAEKAIAERDHARQATADSKRRLDQCEAERQAAAEERDQALIAEREARRSEEDYEAVLAFLRDKLLSAGRPEEWTGRPRDDLTLREAVDAAEPQVAEAFADRPLAEALIRSTLGWTYFYLGDAEQAAQQYEQAFTLRTTALGLNDPTTVSSRNDLARAYRAAGHPDRASSLYDRDPKSPSRAAEMARHGAMLLKQQRAVQAETVLRECLALDEEIQPDSWETFNVKSMLGESLALQKKYDEAEPLLLSAYQGLQKRAAEMPSGFEESITKAMERLADLYQAWGKKEEAARWRKEMQATKPEKKP